MDWGDVGTAVAKYAPMVGMALSSPVGAVAAVGEVVANLFGVKSNPQDVMDYINSNSQKAQERLQYELSNNIEFQKLCLDKIKEQNRHEEEEGDLIISDKESARENSANINKSPVDNYLKMILAIGSIAMFSFCIISMIFFSNSLTQVTSAILGTILGILGKSLTSMIDFYWGSSFERMNEFSNNK